MCAVGVLETESFPSSALPLLPFAELVEKSWLACSYSSLIYLLFVALTRDLNAQERHYDTSTMWTRQDVGLGVWDRNCVFWEVAGCGVVATVRYVYTGDAV